MVVVINDDMVSDVEAYVPYAKAFAADAVANDNGCISMEVLVDEDTPGRVLYLSHFETEEDFKNHSQGSTFQKHLPNLGKYFISAKDTILKVQ